VNTQPHPGAREGPSTPCPVTASADARNASVLMVAYTNYRRDARVRREAEALVDAGHAVKFLARRQADEPANETINGVRVVKYGGLTHGKRSKLAYALDYALFFCRVMAHLLRQPRRYRLVHINNMPDFLALAAWLPRLLGVPVILDVHDLMPELYEEKFGGRTGSIGYRLLALQERIAVRFASSVLTVEAGVKDILVARGAPPQKVGILMNLPDERVFAPRAKPPEHTDRFVLVYHGTLARRLGLDIAVRAVERLRADIPQIELRIIGAGEELEPLRALARERAVDDVVKFSGGYIPIDEIPSRIADADVGVIPLRRSAGTEIMLPTKLMEYAFVGIPCVAPRTRAIARYFDTDMVESFEADDVNSFADAVLRLYVSPERRYAVARAATAGFSQRYRWRTHKQIYLTEVERLLNPNEVIA